MCIKFNLVKFDKYLIFQILEQSNINYKFKESSSFNGFVVYKSDQLDIMISNHPELDKEFNLLSGIKYRLFLRGCNKDRDQNISLCEFDTNEERDKIYDLILDKLKENFK